MDLFADTQNRVNCEYVSQLREKRIIGLSAYSVWELLCRDNDYSMREINDMALYLFGDKTNFVDIEDAKKYFFFHR